MYTGRVACCPWRVSLNMRQHRQTDRRSDGQTDARPLHYAYIYRRGQRKRTCYTLHIGRIDKLLGIHVKVFDLLNLFCYSADADGQLFICFQNTTRDRKS